MQVGRYKDVRSGTLMVVSDLHGDGDAFDRYVATFLALHEMGEADRLILLGDLIHGYGSPDEDASLRMLLHVMELQERFGADKVIMLLGNHEMPHIYGVSLAKGELEFTPRFEQSLGHHRETVLNFLKGLPFAVRTHNGVLLTHAGPDGNSINRITRLNHFDHDALLEDADRTLAQQEDINHVYDTYAQLSGHSYQELAKTYLAVTGPDDPRYSHLMRALFISERDHRFVVLWDFLFTQNERGLVPASYDQLCQRYLDAFSADSASTQQVCVSGHVVVEGGYKVVNERHFRLASGPHARPREAGGYLLIDSHARITSASELIPCFRKVF